MEIPLHSKSCHMQCRCYPIQVQRTSKAMSVFPRISGNCIRPSFWIDICRVN